ncbi:hypothetical protein CYMTET_7403, partial [Cymbomonas tetramitiformis]
LQERSRSRRGDWRGARQAVGVPGRREAAVLADGGVDESFTAFACEQGILRTEAEARQMAAGPQLPTAEHALCSVKVQNGKPEEAAASGEEGRLQVLLGPERRRLRARHPSIIPEIHAAPPNRGLHAVLGIALRVEQVAQDLREGHAGAGGVQPGTTGLERPRGSPEAAPGEQMATLAGQKTAWEAGEAGLPDQGESGALHGRLPGALCEQGESPACARDGDQDGPPLGSRAEREEGRVGANAAGGALGLGGGHQERTVHGDTPTDRKDPSRCAALAELSEQGATVGPSLGASWLQWVVPVGAPCSTTGPLL